MKGAITSNVWRIQRVLLGAILWIGICSVTMGEDVAEATRKAAEQGVAIAQYNLGWMYENGEGVPQDDVESVKWYRKAAEQGNAKAQFNLVRKAAEQGDAKAQIKLGLMYDLGRGVPQDDVEAVRWYRKAEEQGNAGAQYLLGEMYANGRGVLEDDTEAAKWYRKAAEQGNATAQLNLGLMYANGRGVPQDNAIAYAWMSVAATGSDLARKDRDSIKRNLTPTQLKRGQALAKEIFERIQKRKKAAERE